MNGHNINFSSGSWAVSAESPKAFLGKELGLSGSEMSLGFLARGTGSAFVHAHQRNEETYIVMRGKGIFHVDGEEFPIGEGSVVRVAPAGKRAIKAANDSELIYWCIQTDSGSLRQATKDDGIRLKHRTSWLSGE